VNYSSEIPLIYARDLKSAARWHSVTMHDMW